MFCQTSANSVDTQRVHSARLPQFNSSPVSSARRQWLQLVQPKLPLRPRPILYLIKSILVISFILFNSWLVVQRKIILTFFETTFRTCVIRASTYFDIICSFSCSSAAWFSVYVSFFGLKLYSKVAMTCNYTIIVS